MHVTNTERETYTVKDPEFEFRMDGGEYYKPVSIRLETFEETVDEDIHVGGFEMQSHIWKELVITKCSIESREHYSISELNQLAESLDGPDTPYRIRLHELINRDFDSECKKGERYSII